MTAQEVPDRDGGILVGAGESPVTGLQPVMKPKKL
jgi:hypothetical protein